MAKVIRKSQISNPKWRESFTVWIDFIGDRSQVGPLLDHIAGCASDGGGSFLALPLCDQSWTFTQSQTHHLLPEARAFRCFQRIKDACCRRAWSHYIRLRLLHDDKPDRCGGEAIYKKIGKTIRVTHLKRGRGPLVLRRYQRGKCPDLAKVFVKRGKRRRGAKP